MRISLKLWTTTFFSIGLVILIGTAVLHLDLLPSFPQLVRPPQASPAAPTPSITINDQVLTLELANTPEKQRQGLAGHEPLTDTQGMLFPYYPPQQVTFWMKGMTFPIDIVYIADGKIVQIYPQVPPGAGTADTDLSRYPADQPVDYVLETRAGWVQDHQISVGETVTLNL